MSNLRVGNISRRGVLCAAAAVSAAAMLPRTAFAETGGEPVAESWRYSNGAPIEGLEDDGDVSLYGSGPAWGKNSAGQWCNSQGNPIPGALYRGIDVSEWQGSVNWDAVKGSDVNYAILRAAAYSGRADYCWSRNVSECERLGIPFGAYIYSYATSASDAIQEADYIVSLLRGHSPSCPVYIDLEDARIQNSDLNAIAAAFCKRVESAGYRAGIYANLNWWNSKLTSASLNAWSRWVAQYNISCDYAGPKDMWQATSSGSINGINGKVDINFDFSGLAAPPRPANGGVAMYRLYNPNSGEHFYTADLAERDRVVAAGWFGEGVAWYAPEKSSVPVYRLYNPVAGDHHYTTDASERDDIVRAGWRYEGIGWYSDDSEGVPLYRLYNPNAWTGTHHYTLSTVERDRLVAAGWRNEQFAWYGLK